MGVLAIAHRAGNSLARLHEAVELGVDVIEADVHHHRGALEVRHLKTMGPLPFLWDTWELVPTSRPRLGLAEVLRASSAGAVFMLDLKGADAAVGAAVVALLHDEVPDRPVVVCTRHWPALDAFTGVTWVRRVLSARTRAELDLLRPEVRTASAYGVSVHRSLLTQELVAELRESVDVVMTWPVNDERWLRRLLDVGVNGIISDEPEVLRQVIAAR